MTDEAVFSRIDYVQEELGELVVVKGSISVTIDGPGFIDKIGTYTWEAITEFEDGSVSYQWSIRWEGSVSWDDLGTNKTQSVDVVQEKDFMLRVTVQDDSGSDTGFKSVRVECDDPKHPCPQMD
jgi:tartrate dehydratase beta subunit/fumarate hydratase class I family protein